MRNNHKAYKRRVLQHILDNNLKPGMRLPTIDELSTILELSKQSVLEGIKLLKKDGYVEAKPRKGIVIRKLIPSRRFMGSRFGLLYSGSDDYLKMKPWPKHVLDALSGGLPAGRASLDRCSLTHLDRANSVNTAALREIEEKQFDGLFLFELDNDSIILDVRNLGIPMVSVDYDACHLGVPSVTFDNIFGTLSITERLIDLGHRRIAYMRPYTGDGTLTASNLGANGYMNAVERDRYEGYRLAMQRAGLAPLCEESIGPKILRRKLQRLFRLRPAVTAFVTGSDGYATRVGSSVTELGFDIPGDISIAGFGDAGEEILPGMRVSSVRVDYRAMGREAVKLMKRLFKGELSAPERVLIPAEIAEHGSTAAV